MLPIYICDDNEEELGQIRNIINNYIFMEDLDANIICATTDPYELLKYLDTHKTQSLYYLDVDLKQSINGFELAKKIREMDTRGFIIYVTAHQEYSMLAFKYHVEAMDYILKNIATQTFRESIVACLLDTIKIFLSKDNSVSEERIIYKIGNKAFSEQMVNIYTIEKIPNSKRITISGKNWTKEIYLSLSEIEKQLNASFIHCSKSCIANLKHIRKFDDAKQSVILDNEYLIELSKNMYSKFKKKYENYCFLKGNKV